MATSLRLKFYEHHFLDLEKSLLEHGNLCPVSGRLSLRRHYPFPVLLSEHFFVLRSVF